MYAKPDLHPTHAQMLNILKQPVYLNPEELAVLEFFEQYYAARNALDTRDLLLLESRQQPSTDCLRQYSVGLSAT
ncbi:MAG: hypothetical protein KME31_32450 [Tolypothrix carrinoi HA7290-LM1]|nr:hypothetical protein [Tolypothrix carrinoi HA7290-LM1]